MPSTSTPFRMRSPSDTQINFMTELSRATVDALRRLSALHLQLARQPTDDWMNAWRALMSCPDPFQASSLAANTAAPMAEHLRGHQQQLIGVLAGAHHTPD